MADHRAISVVCEAIVRQLRSNYSSELFNQPRLEFKVCLASDLVSRSRTIRAEVTLFLYQVSPNAARRNAPPRRAGDGRLEPPALQLDLRFLLTAWAREANTQQALLGWMMRVMEDQPVLPAAVLNNIASPCFQPEETVEILLDELSSLDLIRIWEKSVRSPYQLSVPYVARNIAIASLQPT